MRVLVTGSEGRVGRCVVGDLLERGHEVIGLDAKTPDQSLEERAGFTPITGSLQDRDTLAEVVPNCESIIHLAAMMSWSDAEAEALMQANVMGTFNLLEEATRSNIERFVFASSGEVYPETGPSFLPVDEHHPANPTSYYGMTKLLGEKMVQFYIRRFDLPTVILRFEHTQDARELLDPRSVFSGPRFFLKGKLSQQRTLGNTEAVRILEAHDDGSEKLLLSRGKDGTPFRMGICETRDMSQGVVLALEALPKIAGETIGIGPDEAVSFDIALRAMHAATGLEMVEANLPGPAVDYVASNAKARELLGFRPRWSFSEMLEEAKEYYEQGRASGAE